MKRYLRNMIKNKQKERKEFLKKSKNRNRKLI